MTRPTVKVLDLGAHDGFVGAWVRNHLAEDFREIDVEIHGVELHPRGCEEAVRRGYTQCVQGLAEDAERLLPKHVGTFDAVIAFEILEHVVDMDRFLGVCEAMLRPGGRVYISTPDGCFGDGMNPHHLRALRALDVADILRRRGKLVEMQVGGDGVTIATYQKDKPRAKTAGIYVGQGWDRWAPMDINMRGLGGSETAAVNLARQLSAIGYVTTVYADVEQCAYEDVIYRDTSVFDPLEQRDLLIVSRVPEVFDRPHLARRAVLWMHDTDYGDRLQPRHLERIDKVAVLSQWHKRHVTRTYPFAAGKVGLIRNGLELDRFAGEQLERAPRVLYTSSFDRGLDRLLEWWPKIRERVPEAELAFSYAPVYFKIADMHPPLREFHNRIMELADQPGVTMLGSLPQDALATLMRESMVWAHPSYNTPSGQPFHETSCIGAMEAQAAGMVVVASNWGALSETVEHGSLVDSGELWEEHFVEEIVRGLTRGDVREEAQRAGPRAMRTKGWRPVAQAIAG